MASNSPHWLNLWRCSGSGPRRKAPSPCTRLKQPALSCPSMCAPQPSRPAIAVGWLKRQYWPLRAYVLAERGADHELQAEWAAGLGRLTTRQAFPHDRESFFYRPLELLGICLGLSTSKAVTPEHRRWLIDVVKQGPNRTTEADPWTQLLRARAAYALGVCWHLPHLLRPQDCELEELALLVWLHLTDAKLLEALELGGREQEYAEMLLQRTALAPLPELDASRAAVLHIALAVVIERTISSSTERYWQFGRDSRDAVELVHRRLTACKK